VCIGVDVTTVRNVVYILLYVGNRCNQFGLTTYLLFPDVLTTTATFIPSQTLCFINVFLSVTVEGYESDTRNNQ